MARWSGGEGRGIHRLRTWLVGVNKTCEPVKTRRCEWVQVVAFWLMGLHEVVGDLGCNSFGETEHGSASNLLF